MITQPVNTPLYGRKYKLAERYVYEWADEEGVLNRIIVPEGFINDGASIPRIFWTVFGLTPDGIIRAAALIHDFILVNKGRLKSAHQKFIMGQWIPANQLMTKKTADRLFYNLAIEGGVKKWKSKIAYLTLRIYTRFNKKYEWK